MTRLIRQSGVPIISCPESEYESLFRKKSLKTSKSVIWLNNYKK